MRLSDVTDREQEEEEKNKSLWRRGKGKETRERKICGEENEHRARRKKGEGKRKDEKGGRDNGNSLIYEIKALDQYRMRGAPRLHS